MVILEDECYDFALAVLEVLGVIGKFHREFLPSRCDSKTQPLAASRREKRTISFSAAVR
jgi:hypothetical protein